jgi:hypothetical protein
VVRPYLDLLDESLKVWWEWLTRVDHEDVQVVQSLLDEGLSDAPEVVGLVVRRHDRHDAPRLSRHVEILLWFSTFRVKFAWFEAGNHAGS